MKIFLAGASGQLGLALQVALGEHDVIAAGHDMFDITRLDHVRNLLGKACPDLVINAAAYTDVDGAESDQVRAYQVNALGPRNLAKATADLQIPLVHISTDYVFNGAECSPYHEFDRPSPQSVYGLSKLAGEEAVRGINPRHYVVRTAWLFHTVGRNFLKTMCSMATRPEVRVVSDQFGSPTYAPYLAGALSQVIMREPFGTYHLAGKGGTSWFELTRTLYCKLGIKTPVKPVSTAEFPRAAQRPKYSVLTSLQNPLIQLPSWEEGVKAFVKQVGSSTLKRDKMTQQTERAA
jgi:dTDP-4-dehydrorhamnose reductase